MISAGNFQSLFCRRGSFHQMCIRDRVPTQLASVLPRAASYELELRTEEGNRSYTVNCHDKDGNTFRSYTMQTVEGEEEPLNFTYTDYTYGENGNCTDCLLYTSQHGRHEEWIYRSNCHSNRIVDKCRYALAATDHLRTSKFDHQDHQTGA